MFSLRSPLIGLFSLYRLQKPSRCVWFAGLCGEKNSSPQGRPHRPAFYIYARSTTNDENFEADTPSRGANTITKETSQVVLGAYARSFLWGSPCAAGDVPGTTHKPLSHEKSFFRSVGYLFVGVSRAFILVVPNNSVPGSLSLVHPWWGWFVVRTEQPSYFGHWTGRVPLQ